MGGGKEEKTASTVDFQPICDFHNREIDRLERNIEELAADVVTESDLYKKLTNSSRICSVIGYLALPECATKEGLNVFEKLDDKCAENKTNSIRNSLLKLLRLEIEVSGQAIFRSCKDIVVKQLKGQFEKMLELISGLCDQSSLSTSNRRKRSYGGGYYPGGYDPNTIWFQYLLCHEQKITCYFFTDGWNDKDYGQYYLYQNVLDTGFDSLGDDDDLLALALLSGAGGLQQHPYQAFPGYPSYRKRRDVDDEENVVTTVPTTEDGDEAVSSGGMRRRSVSTAPTTEDGNQAGGRRRRSGPSTPSTEDGNEIGGRRRRNVPTTPTTEDGKEDGGRRRRNVPTTPTTEDGNEDGGRRRRNVPTTPTTEDGKEDGGRRRRNVPTTPTTED